MRKDKNLTTEQQHHPVWKAFSLGAFVKSHQWWLFNITVAWGSDKSWGKLFKNLKKKSWRASLVAQWLRIRLPTQGTWVWSLVREDPTCCGATKPIRHNYWACALDPTSHNYWARVLQLLKPARLEPVFHNKRSHRNEKPVHHKEE